MSKYALALIVAVLCLGVVTVLSASFEDLNRIKRIISDGEEKDLPELTRVKRFRRKSDDNAEAKPKDEANDIHARIKQTRKETKAITHKLEKALSRVKGLDVGGEEKGSPKALERVKRFRRGSVDDGPEAHRRTKRVKKGADENQKALQRVKRMRRKAEDAAFQKSGLHKRSSGKGVDKLNRVKRQKRVVDDDQKILARYKRLKRAAENPKLEVSRLKRKVDSISDARMQRVKRE